MGRNKAIRGEGFVKQIGSKPGVKERRSYIDEQSGESKEVMDAGIEKPVTTERNSATHTVTGSNNFAPSSISSIGAR